MGVLRLRFLSVICVVVSLAGHAHSHPTGTAYPSYPTHLLRRQDPQPPTPSINWWPYPSWDDWGQATSTAETSNGAPTATPVASDQDNNHAVVSTTSGSDTSLAAAPTSTTSSPESPVNSSSASLVRITALPPASSASSLTHSRALLNSQVSHATFNVVYLAPLFGVLGAIAGALCTWLLLYRFLPISGRRRSREPTLVPGPRYTPPTRVRRGAPPAYTVPPPAGEAQTHSSGQGLLPSGTAGGGSIKGSWLGRAFSLRSKAAPTEQDQCQDEARIGAVGAAENDPFLNTFSPEADSTPTKHAAVQRRATDASALSQVDSQDPYSTVSDSEEAAPYETLRHKSIRRGILERLQFGSIHRPTATYERGQTEEYDNDSSGGHSIPAPRNVQHRRTHKRVDSDTGVHNTPSRRPTLAWHRSQLGAPPPGFRIVVEDPETGALLDADATSPPHTPPPAEPLTHMRVRRASDIFTPVPARRSTEEKRNSPYNSGPFTSPSKPAQHRPSASASISVSVPASVTPSAAASGMPVAAPHPPRVRTRVDSSVLPASPPMITSPPLESQLFFGSTPSLSLQFPPQPCVKPPPSASRPIPVADARKSAAAEKKEEKGKGKDKKEHKKKLQTHRASPPLPFPTSAVAGAASHLRALLKKPKAAPIPVAFSERAESSSSTESDVEGELEGGLNAGGEPAKPRTPAERYHARRAALRKVDEIVSRSWSERQLSGGDGFLGSPNNFGNFTVGRGEEREEEDAREAALLGTGIEQRLEALRERVDLGESSES